MTTKVTPGALDAFAKYVDELAEAWNKKGTSPAVQMAQSKEGDYDYPRFGDFGAGQTLKSTYEQKRAAMAQAGGDLYDALQGLAEATRKVADDYRSAEARNNASVGAIEKILGEHIQISGGGDPDQPPQEPKA